MTEPAERKCPANSGNIDAIVENLWRPHLGALHTMITAADYDGIFRLVSSISRNIGRAALSAAGNRQSEGGG